MLNSVQDLCDVGHAAQHTPTEIDSRPETRARQLAAAALRVFNVLDVNTFKLVDHAAGLALRNEMGLEGVPHLGTIVLGHTVDQLVAMSEGTSVLNPVIQREGLVLRPLANEYDEDIGGRLSFKAINPKFLLKYDEYLRPGLLDEKRHGLYSSVASRH